jgi:hypothetical protein
MNADDITKAIAALAEDEAELIATIKTAEATLVRVRGARAALQLLAAPLAPAEFEGKLADACREVLRRHKGTPLAPLAVRAGLKEIGFTMPVRKNQMAYVHAVLKRMAGANKDVRTKVVGGTTCYYWAGPEPVLNLTTTTNLGASANSLAEMLTANRVAIDAMKLGPSLVDMFKHSALGPDAMQSMRDALRASEAFTGEYKKSAQLVAEAMRGLPKGEKK